MDFENAQVCALKREYELAHLRIRGILGSKHKAAQSGGDVALEYASKPPLDDLAARIGNFTFSICNMP